MFARDKSSNQSDSALLAIARGDDQIGRIPPQDSALMSSSSNRREFLRGQAALRAARTWGDQLAGDVSQDGEAAWTEERGGYLLRYARTAMACEFEVLLNYHDQGPATPAAFAALDLVEELEAQLTVYRESSEVSCLNRQALDQPIVVEQRLFELLVQATQLWQATAGAYDITSGPLTKVWGFYQRQGRLPSADEIAAALARVGSQHLELDGAAGTLRITQPGVELNLGSIGKGYALDRCAEVFAESNVPNYLLHGGNSSLLARGGQGTDDCWWVGVRDPLRPERRLFELAVRDRAVGTSGAAVQFFVHRGQRYGHIIDPRNGWPARDMLSVTVLAPTAAAADAHSTALYVLGKEAALSYLQQRPEIAACLFTPGSKSGSWELTTANLPEHDLRRAISGFDS